MEEDRWVIVNTAADKSSEKQQQFPPLVIQQQRFPPLVRQQQRHACVSVQRYQLRQKLQPPGPRLAVHQHVQRHRSRIMIMMIKETLTLNIC